MKRVRVAAGNSSTPLRRRTRSLLANSRGTNAPIVRSWVSAGLALSLACLAMGCAPRIPSVQLSEDYWWGSVEGELAVAHCATGRATNLVASLSGADGAYSTLNPTARSIDFAHARPTVIGDLFEEPVVTSLAQLEPAQRINLSFRFTESGSDRWYRVYTSIVFDASTMAALRDGAWVRADGTAADSPCATTSD